MHRRHFIAAASLTATGLTSPAELHAQASAPAPAPDPRVVPRYAQDAWYDKLPGKHRLFVDATNDAEAGAAVGYAWNFMHTSQTGYNLKDEDLAVIICLRHEATAFAFSNDVWAKYAMLRKYKYKHPDTGKRVRGGNVFRLGSLDPKSVDEGFTLEGMAKRGVHFAVCGAATRGLAGMLAGEKASKDDRERIIDELIASAPANAHFMASGILAAQRAGEYAYTVVHA